MAQLVESIHNMQICSCDALVSVACLVNCVYDVAVTNTCEKDLCLIKTDSWTQ